MYYATLERKGLIKYVCIQEEEEQLRIEINKVTRPGDLLKFWHGYYNLMGEFISETEEPYNEYEVE